MLKSKFITVHIIVICSVIFISSTTSDRSNINSTSEEIPSEYVKESIPMPLNRDTLKMIFFFQTERREAIIKSLSLMDGYLPRIKEIFKEEGVPVVLAYLPFIESAYDPLAHSNRGAKGIWQFIPSTARRHGLRVDSWIDERINPEKSCRAAARFLKYYKTKFGNWTLALAAYNGGPTRINRAIRRLKTRDFWKIKKTRYIRPQTKRYIPAFIAGVYIAKSPLLFGFLYEKKAHTPYDLVEIPTQTDLSVIAKCVNSDIDTLKRLNPELRRPITPYRYENYKLRIPRGSIKNFELNYSKIPPGERVLKRYHKIRRGDTLLKIANHYGTTVKSIMNLNNIYSPRRLQIGQTIVVPIIPGKEIQYNVRKYTRQGSYRRYKKGQELEYRVRRGDSLYKIASRFRTDIASICNWNKIEKDDILLPGTRLNIKYATRITINSTQLRDGAFLTYTVRKGDTLYDIAKEHNVTIASLRYHNNIRGSRLYPGEKLVIPIAID